MIYSLIREKKKKKKKESFYVFEAGHLLILEN